MWWWILVIVVILVIAYIWRRSEHLTAAQIRPVTVEAIQSALAVEEVWPQSGTFTGPAVDLPEQEPAPQVEPPPVPHGQAQYTPDPFDGRIGLHRGDINLPPPIRR